MASLKKMSVADLRRELERREKGSHKLLKQHAKLAKRLAALDAELSELGVEVPARAGRKPGRMGRGPGRPKGSKNKSGGKRARNTMSLLEAIVFGVRVGSTVSPVQAAAAAKAKGYKSSSPNLGMMVANQLAKAPMFKRVGRGQYQHVGGKGAGRPAKRGRRKPGRPKGTSNKPSGAPKATEATET